jgi:hypothetical protein
MLRPVAEKLPRIVAQTGIRGFATGVAEKAGQLREWES